MMYGYCGATKASIKTKKQRHRLQQQQQHQQPAIIKHKARARAWMSNVKCVIFVYRYICMNYFFAPFNLKAKKNGQNGDKLATALVCVSVFHFFFLLPHYVCEFFWFIKIAYDLKVIHIESKKRDSQVTLTMLGFRFGVVEYKKYSHTHAYFKERTWIELKCKHYNFYENTWLLILIFFLSYFSWPLLPSPSSGIAIVSSVLYSF